MIQLHLPWIELSIAIPLLGALVAFQLRDRSLTRRFSIVVCGLTLVSTLCAWQDFNSLTTFEAHDRWDLFTTLFGIDLFVIDELSAPLIPLAALLYLMTTLATLRTKVRRFSFGSSLISEAILIATLSCREAWALIFLLALAGGQRAVHGLIVADSQRRQRLGGGHFQQRMLPFPLHWRL